MPTGFVKKIAKEKDTSVGSVEKKWEQAKAIAQKEYGADHWAVTTAIFKKLEKQ